MGPMHAQVIDSDLHMCVFLAEETETFKARKCVCASEAPAAPLGNDPMMQLVS